MTALAMWGVPGGLIGARVYSLITSWQVDTQGQWYRAFEIWNGGLGIWGGVVGGIALGAIGAKRMHLPRATLLDCIAPAFALGQAIGRWGNYFNQELFGRPTKLPWAVKIDPSQVQQLPLKYQHYSTFQPTFLYECRGTWPWVPHHRGREAVQDQAGLSDHRVRVALHVRALLDRIPPHR